MKVGTRFVVKRFAPMMGYTVDAPRRVTVAFHAYTVEAAVDRARVERSRGVSVWVERRDVPAHRTASRSRERLSP